MKIELPEIRLEDRTPLVEALLGLIRQLADRVAELEEANRELRDEIAVLKGQKPRPKISPSILTTTPEANDGSDKKPRKFRRLGGSADRLSEHQRAVEGNA